MLYYFRYGNRDRTQDTSKHVAFCNVISPTGETFTLYNYAEFCFTNIRETLTQSFYKVMHCEIGDMISWDGEYWTKI